jgi:hypothetical protein
MELDFALLADAAQVVEGKTYILGGGATILWRENYPAPLGFVLVCQLTHDRSEAGSEHEFRLRVRDVDGNPVLPETHGRVRLGSPSDDVPPDVPIAAPVVMLMPAAPVLQRPGAYAVDLVLDGQHVKSLPFAVARPPTAPSS